MGLTKMKNSDLQKKKIEAEQKALQKVKNELKLRDEREKFALATTLMKKLKEDQEEMNSRKKELEKLVEHKERKQQKILGETGMAKFRKSSEKGSEINATVEDLKHTCFMLHNINSNIKQREIRSNNRLHHSLESFYDLRHRDNIANDLLNLLIRTPLPLTIGKSFEKEHPTSSDNLLFNDEVSAKKEKKARKRRTKSMIYVENRRRQLVESISSLTENIHIKKHLNHMRCASDEWKEMSLEEYVDTNLRRIDLEIQTLSKEIQLINADIIQTSDNIENRRMSISLLKKAAKRISKKDVANAPPFHKVISINEEMQSEIDRHLKISEELLEESASLVIELDDHNAEAENSDVGNKIRFLIQENIEKEDFDIEKESEESDRKYKQLVQEIEEGESTLKKISIETESMKLELDKSSDKLSSIKLSVTDMAMKSNACVEVISQLSQRVLENVPC